MDNYYNYFTEIEEHFWRKRGKHLLVSPLDWCLIDLWKSNGIPLHVALRGIDRSFESADKRSRRAPTTLFYCHPAVMEAFEEFGETQLGAQESASGESPPPLSREEVAAYLGYLREALGKFEGEPFARAVESLAALSNEVRSRSAPNYEEIDRSLGQMGDRIYEWLLQGLSPDESKAFRKEVRSELKIYKKRLSPEMYKKLERNYMARELRRRHHIPELSLFEADAGMGSG